MWNPKETINHDLEVCSSCGKLFTRTILQSHKRNHTVFQNETRRKRPQQLFLGQNLYRYRLIQQKCTPQQPRFLDFYISQFFGGSQHTLIPIGTQYSWIPKAFCPRTHIRGPADYQQLEFLEFCCLMAEFPTLHHLQDLSHLSQDKIFLEYRSTTHGDCSQVLDLS